LLEIQRLFGEKLDFFHINNAEDFFMPSKTFLRSAGVRQKLGGIGGTTFWRIRANDPTFPPPIMLTPSLPVWDELAVENWLASRRSGDSANEAAS